MTLSGLLSGSGTSFETPRALYIHVPFCDSRCAYCDFHSFPRSAVPPALQSLYVEKILERAELLSRALSASYTTMYIGGGTPTILADDTFDRLIGGLGRLFGGSVREWTVEANPESLSVRKLDTLLANSVSRISLGIQTMDEEELGILGRKAGLADNRRAIALAAGSGLAVSADLIGCVPVRPGKAGRKGASRTTLRETVAFLVESGVGHLSIYDLVVEDGTVIKKLLDERKLVPADEDRSYEERKETEGFLDRMGFDRYEVSNYAKPGAECLHNMAYWSMNSYLGVGSGAVSTLNIADREAARRLDHGGSFSLRIEEGRNLTLYADSPDDVAAFSWIEEKDSAFETVMMALRTAAGLDEKSFEDRFGMAPRTLLAGTIEKWKSFFPKSPGRLRLADGGLDLLNRILVDALGEMEPFFAQTREGRA